jgi:hypothetical protein
MLVINFIEMMMSNKKIISAGNHQNPNQFTPPTAEPIE